MSRSQVKKLKEMHSRLSTILLCGVPGIGKTTLIQKIYKKIQKTINVNCRGFYTEEVCEDDNGRRLGFDVITLKGLRGVLARDAIDIENVDCPTVGKYRVFLREFESIALPPLVTCPRSYGELLVIDELGKMELKSNKFVTTIKSLLNQVPILATAPLKTDRVPIVEEITNSPNTKVFNVTLENRDQLVDEIMRDLKAILT